MRYDGSEEQEDISDLRRLRVRVRDCTTEVKMERLELKVDRVVGVVAGLTKNDALTAQVAARCVHVPVRACVCVCMRACEGFCVGVRER